MSDKRLCCVKQNTHIDQLAEKVSADTCESVLINALCPVIARHDGFCRDTIRDQYEPWATLSAHYRRITLDYRPGFYSIRSRYKIKSQQ